MRDEKDLTEIHPMGEREPVGDEAPETTLSLDTFGGKIHVKWVPEGAVSALGQMAFFIEFLKTSGLFDAWVSDWSTLVPRNIMSRRNEGLKLTRQEKQALWF